MLCIWNVWVSYYKEFEIDIYWRKPQLSIKHYNCYLLVRPAPVCVLYRGFLRNYEDFFWIWTTLGAPVSLAADGFLPSAQCRSDDSVWEPRSPSEDHLSLPIVLKSQTVHHSQGRQWTLLQKISETAIFKKLLPITAQHVLKKIKSVTLLALNLLPALSTGPFNLLFKELEGSWPDFNVSSFLFINWIFFGLSGTLGLTGCCCCCCCCCCDEVGGGVFSMTLDTRDTGGGCDLLESAASKLIGMIWTCSLEAALCLQQRRDPHYLLKYPLQVDMGFILHSVFISSYKSRK